MNVQRPLKRFPFPIGIGTDICQISRIHAILRNPTRGHRFVDRILSAEERDLNRVRRVLGNYKEEKGRLDNVDIARFLAGRFAAKESAFKAWSPLPLSFHSVSIRPAEGDPESGPVVAVVHGEVSDRISPISISHDGDYATAVCLGFPAGFERDRNSTPEDVAFNKLLRKPRKHQRGERREAHRRDYTQKEVNPDETETRSR